MLAWKALFAFVALAAAYTKPTTQNWGALYTPNTSDPVVQGEQFNITWANPSGVSVKGKTVSLVLCRGPSTNCVLDSKAIVQGVPAGKKFYLWNVPANQPLGKQNTAKGNGMLIIEDGTGDFQYSTQFSVVKKK